MSHNHSILLILPGPKYKLEETLGPKLQFLSQRFRGVVITTGQNKQRLKIGKFLVIAGQHHESALREYWCFRQLVKEHLKDPIIIKALGVNPLVVTYDPLRAGLVGLIAKNLLRAPFVVEVNGIFQSPANYIDSPNLLKRITGRLRNVMVARFVLKRADGIKILFANQLIGLYEPSPAQTVACFFDWVPTSAFTKKKMDASDTNTILFVGFPHYLKGVDLLIAAFKALYPTHRLWRLKILGYYSDKTIIDRAIGNHPAIEYHPPVFADEMPQHIANCSIFILPSRCEAMGRVLIEAAAAGKARLASDVGGIPTVIADGRDGLLFR